MKIRFLNSNFLFQSKYICRSTILNKQTQLYIYELISSSVDDQKLKNDINFEINKRLSWPLLNLALASIAISTILSTHYNRIWKYKNTILGISQCVDEICDPR